MALSQLQVFQEEVQTTMTEVQDQAIDKFNGAVNGGIILTSKAHEGDFSSTAIWAKIAGLVKRRNPYGTGVRGDELDPDSILMILSPTKDPRKLKK